MNPKKSTKVTRRHLLQAATIGSGLLVTNTAHILAASPIGKTSRHSSPGEGKTLLVLGGTRFLGPAVVEEAISRGYKVTLFNRGRSNPDMFPDLEKLRGDRDNQLDSLKGRKWDAVVDTSGYVPRHVKLTAELLAPNTEHYVFVSSISVYADEGNPMPEEHPIAVLKEPGTETVDNETYGPLKALCELAAESAMPGRVSNIRPGLIVGPRDNSGRFTYWPWRVAQGGEILSPGDPASEVEFIDVRDLATFMMHCVDNKLGGVFNANGPGFSVSMQEFLHGCKIVLGSNAKFTWIPDESLLEMGAQPWMEVPLWIPASVPKGSTVIDKALKAGLSHRSVGDTIRDTNLWLQTALDNPRTLGRSLKTEKETELLAQWHGRSTQD